MSIAVDNPQSAIRNPQSPADPRMLRDVNIFSKATADAFEDTWRRNWSLNWPVCSQRPGVMSFFGRLGKNISAIVCSAGPDLEAALPVLRDVQDRFLIVAVDRAYQRMIDAGVYPHITFAHDPQPQVAKYFEGHRPGDIVAVCPWVDPGVIRAVGRDDICCYTETHDANKVRFWILVEKFYFRGVTNRFGRIPPGGTVTSLAHGLAVFMNAKAVIHAGLNLSVPADKKAEMGINIIPINGDDGRPVFYTNGPMLFSKNWFEEIGFPAAWKRGVKIVNATENSILTENCLHKTIEHVAAKRKGPRNDYAALMRKWMQEIYVARN